MTLTKLECSFAELEERVMASMVQSIQRDSFLMDTFGLEECMKQLEENFSLELNVSDYEVTQIQDEYIFTSKEK